MVVPSLRQGRTEAVYDGDAAQAMGLSLGQLSRRRRAAGAAHETDG